MKKVDISAMLAAMDHPRPHITHIATTLALQHTLGSMALQSLASNATRLSQRIQENFKVRRRPCLCCALLTASPARNPHAT